MGLKNKRWLMIRDKARVPKVIIMQHSSISSDLHSPRLDLNDVQFPCEIPWRISSDLNEISMMNRKSVDK